MREKLATYGVWTYRGAWVLEIIAALIGLATGLALGIQAFSASEEVNAMELVLASAPFFMVALAELTKIPIATLLFSAGWRWKPIVLIFLVALAGITFETVFMGLERAATLRQLQYETLTKDLAARRFEAETLRQSVVEAQSVDEVEASRSEIERLSALADVERLRLQEQIGAIDTQVAGERALPPEAVLIRESLTEAKADRATLIAEQSAEMDSAVRQFESQRDSYVERARVQRESGDLVAAQQTETDLRALSNPRIRLEQKQGFALASADERIRSLQDRFDALAAQSTPMSEVQLDALRARKNDLSGQMDSTTARWNAQLDAARDSLADAQAFEAVKGARVAESQSRLDVLGKEIATLESERIPMARTDQIRRIAARLFGSEPEDVTQEQAGLVSVLWFGSLAMLAALAGPVTAIVALALQRLAAPEVKHPSPLSRSLRRLIVHWRWRRIRSVTVPIEVQVPVEVEKRVEVPVEVVVKEVLYVPILTDDPELVMRALEQSLPAEVSSLVKASTKGGGRAGKAQHVAS
jgi:hypothetical protein